MVMVVTVCDLLHYTKLGFHGSGISKTSEHFLTEVTGEESHVILANCTRGLKSCGTPKHLQGQILPSGSWQEGASVMLPRNP